MSVELEQHLGQLGISELSAELYRSLLEHGSAPAAELAQRLAADPAQVRASLDELTEMGVVAPQESPDQAYVVLDPAAALRTRRAALELQIATSIDASLAAYAHYRRNHGRPSTDAGVELLRGAEIGPRVAELERATEHEFRAFDTAPYGDTAWENPIEIANLARGVGYRVLYAKSSIETPELYERNIVPCIEAGEVARCTASVPVKMCIADDAVALVGLSADRADAHHTALEVRSEQLVAALAALFELRWEAATPLLAAEDLHSELRPIEVLLLRQLAIGVTDEAAARTLRISSRTVARYVERLMRISGASSRFQLAVYAGKRGWLE